MLVLTRKKKEALIITVDDRQIIVRVVANSQGRVRLGVTADDSVRVVREELEVHDGETL